MDEHLPITKLIVSTLWARTLICRWFFKFLSWPKCMKLFLEHMEFFIFFLRFWSFCCFCWSDLLFVECLLINSLIDWLIDWLIEKGMSSLAKDLSGLCEIFFVSHVFVMECFRWLSVRQIKGGFLVITSVGEEITMELENRLSLYAGPVSISNCHCEYVVCIVY